MVVVEVTAATDAVKVGTDTPQHEQALLYCVASAQPGLTYAGIVLPGAVGETLVVGVRFAAVMEVETTASWGGVVVTVTVTAEL